jgi:hypothetical protein
MGIRKEGARKKTKKHSEGKENKLKGGIEIGKM